MERMGATAWQQGSVIAPSDLQCCVKVDSETACDVMGVLISHDCDIANSFETEPYIEVILARTLDTAADGNCTFAKNPRRLHLAFDGPDKRYDLELIAHEKCRVDKQQLFSRDPAPGWVLDAHGRQILQGWLASRYRRHALPDELVERLVPLFSFLAKKLKPHATEIAGIWLNYDPEGALTPDEPYELWMYIVYNQEENGVQDKAEGLAMEVTDRFENLMLKNRDAGSVLLNECIAVAGTGFTLDDLRKHVELKMEHLSHRAYPIGDVLMD